MQIFEVLYKFTCKFSSDRASRMKFKKSSILYGHELQKPLTSLIHLPWEINRYLWDTYFCPLKSTYVIITTIRTVFFDISCD